MIKFKVTSEPDKYDNCMCRVVEADIAHSNIFGSIKVDFSICNPECNITPGDIVVVNSATVYTVVAGEIVDIEHNEP